MKRIAVLLGLLVALSLVFATGAYANFGPHGGYAADTDACAACHRAHSSFSSLTFEEKIPTPVNTYALLVGSASTMTEFCNTCHGDAAVGAGTNVMAGQFDSGPSASRTDSSLATVLRPTALRSCTRPTRTTWAP